MFLAGIYNFIQIPAKKHAGMTIVIIAKRTPPLLNDAFILYKHHVKVGGCAFTNSAALNGA